MTTDRNKRSARIPQGFMAIAAAGAAVMVFSVPASAQSTDTNQRPYLPSVPPTNPNPSDTRPTPQDTRPGQPQPVVTAAVAGIQVTTAATTVAPTVVTVAQSPASVLGVTIEEQAEDVAFTGSESGRFTGAGVALTAVGAMLIGVTRRRRRADH